MGIIILISIITFISACTSIDIPTVNESKKSIVLMLPQLKATELLIKAKSYAFLGKSDINLKIKKHTINRLLNQLAKQTARDIEIIFPATKPLLKEDKDFLGIKYTNYINVENGLVVMDIKTLKFLEFNNNEIKSIIEIEGTGKIELSGRNTGIQAKVKSKIDLYLKDSVSFFIKPASNGNIILVPKPKKVILKSKFTISLLEWQIPWHEEIELEISDIINPLPINLSLSPEINFQMPANKYGKNKTKEVPFIVEFYNSKIVAKKDVLELKTNVKFTKR